MRINEYNSLEEFTSQYIGEWGPSDGHWLGLEFAYHGKEYRLHTGPMYTRFITILPDGRPALFGFYEKIKEYEPDNTSKEEERAYRLLGEYADMDDLLNKCFIDGKPFKEVIMADETRILAQD